MPSAAELRQEAIWRRCKRDCQFFLQRFFKIQHPERGCIEFEMYEAQIETLKVWLRERLSLALKARQIGFSTLAAGLVLWDVMFHDDRLDIMLSKTERDAQKLLAKVTYGYDRLPDWMRHRGPRRLTNNLQKLEFDNGSSVESLPASDPARGMSAFRIIVDEWAFFEAPEKAWAAIEPATDIGGRIIALSTANGSGNLYHEMWVKARTGKSAFKPIFYSWRAVTGRGDDWYETKRRSMQEWQLHQEYPSTEEEAFIRSGRTYFDIDMLKKLAEFCRQPRVGYLKEKPDSNRAFTFIENGDGPLFLYELPQRGVRYAIGADIAEGLDHGDYSVAHVINTQSGLVAAKWRGHVDPDLFGSDILWALGWFYNRALIGPESNNHGHATIAALNRAGYPNLYSQHTYDEKTMKKTKRLGWRTQVNTKPLALDELSQALRDEELTLLDEATFGELRTFVRDENGKTHGSPYDDEVMSVAIANQMRKHTFTMVENPDQEYEWGSLGWWEQQIVPPNDEWLIGAHSRRS